MENELIELCLEEIFTDENITTIWENRNSDEDIISLNTNLPIRYKKNDLNGRNVEIIRGSEIGDICCTIILVENDNFFFPSDVYKLANRFFNEYNKVYTLSQTFRREYHILMGAFSIQSYYQAYNNTDVESYYSYDIEFEILKAFDGSLQTFTKESSKDLMMFSSLQRLAKTSLDDVAISAFVRKENYLELFPTLDSKDWVETLKKKRLLELYTI